VWTRISHEQFRFVAVPLHDPVQEVWMTLAVFTSQIGPPSETFIRLHLERLLPGRTVVVARTGQHPGPAFWKTTCPALLLDDWASRLPVRLARRFGAEESLKNAAVAKFLRAHNVTVALGEYLDQFLEFVPVLVKLGVPYVAQGHGIDVSASLRTPGARERYLAYNSARVVLTRCEFHRQRLLGLGLRASTVAVNPGGVDVPMRPISRAQSASKRLLAVGRMVPKKGPIYLLEAFRRAAAQDTGISLDYIGGGPLFAAVAQFVAACGLQERVRLHGFASEETKQRLFIECGVFVQHSITDPETGDEEGLPAAIQEAMAHAMAVISTRHAGIPEAVADGVTGALVDEGDVVGMSDAILDAAANPERTRGAGLRAHTRALGDFQWDDERRRLLGFLG
jgi:glycosyltransferase involved in cell wall biosynthesis